jgi:hypothetical protein
MLALGLTTGFRAVGNATAQRAFFNLNVVSGVTYTFSYYIWIDSLSALSVREVITDSLNTTVGSFQSLTTIGSWMRVEQTVTAYETATWAFRMAQQVGAGAMDVYVTGIMIEAVAGPAGSYFDGGLGVWLGTPQLSQSAQLIPGVGGNAINAFWRSGWFTFGSQLVKTNREMKISGSGLVTVAVSRDYRQTPSMSTQRELSPAEALYDSGLLYDSAGLIYGPSNTVTTKSIRKATRGEAFSITLSNNVINRTFRVHRLTNHVRDVRVPSVVKVN